VSSEPAAAQYVNLGSNKIYDVDLAASTKESLFLFECKRKVLTNAARAGATYFTILDLSRSFLEQLIQLARHELELFGRGTIDFQDGTRLSRGERKIELIALTMLDHGSLQNSAFTRNLVDALWTIKFGSDDPTAHAELEKINGKIVELKSLLERIAQTKGQDFTDFYRRHRFVVWWLSVDQLAVLLAQGNDLRTTLNSVRHLTFGTGDLMNEFALANRLKADAKTTAAPRVPPMPDG
jgi:hypothetical protein